MFGRKIMLIRNEKGLEQFKETQGIDTVTKEY